MLAGNGLDETWLREHPRRLAATTVEQVAVAASTMLAPAAFTGVVVGDLDAIAGGLRALGSVTLP
jgi:zinc protease